MSTLTNKITKKKVLIPSASGALFYLGFYLSIGAFSPFLNVYYSDLGLTGQQIGWLATLIPLMQLLLATPLSSLADRKRWRVRITQIGIVGVSLVMFTLRYPTAFAGIAWLMLLLAAFFSPIMSITDSLIARMARRHDLNYGAMRLWGSIGFASSALGFGALWQRFGFRPMFLVGCLLFLPLVWIAGQLEEVPTGDKEERGAISVLTRDRGLVLLLIATFLAGIPISLSINFEGIYMRSLGGGNFLIGVMSAFAAYSELPTMYYGQRVAQRLSGPITVMLAYGLMACAYLGFVLVAVPVVVPLFSIIKGLGFGLFFSNTVRIINERAPEKWASTAQSFMTVGMFGLAPLVAGPLGGLVHDTFSPAGVFWLAIIALGLAAAVLRVAALKGEFE